MKKILLSLALSLAVSAVYAVEGGPWAQDRLMADAVSFDHIGSYGGKLEGEVQVVEAEESWAIVAGILYRSVDPDWTSGSYSDWGGELGVKCYFSKLTGLSLVGAIEGYDYLGYSDVSSLTARFRHRFSPAREGVSPYVEGWLGMRWPDHAIGDAESEKRGDDYIAKLGAGCDFMLTETLSMVFEGFYCAIIETGSDDDYEDGWIASVGFAGYWD